jgi:hypothetical protein
LNERRKSKRITRGKRKKEKKRKEKKRKEKKRKEKKNKNSVAKIRSEYLIK